MACELGQEGARYASQLHLRTSPLAGLHNCLTLRPGHDWAAVMAEPSTLFIISLGFEDDTGHSVTPGESTPASTSRVDGRSTASCDVPKAEGLPEGEASQGLRSHLTKSKPGEVFPAASQSRQGPGVLLTSRELSPRNPTSASGGVAAGSLAKGTEGSKVEEQKRGMRILQRLDLPHLCAATWLPDGRALVVACRGVAHLYQVEGETLKLMITFPLFFWPKAIQASLICENDGRPDQFFLYFGTAAGLAVHLLHPPNQGNESAAWTTARSHVMEPVWQMCAITVSPDGALLAAAGLAGQLWIWDVLESFCLLAEEHVPFERVTSLAFSPDNCRLAVACWGGAVLLYHSLKPQLVPAHPLHSPLQHPAPSCQSPTTPCAVTCQSPMRSPCTAESATDLSTRTQLGDLVEVASPPSVQPSGVGEVGSVSHGNLVPACWEDILLTSSPDEVAGAHDVLAREGEQCGGTISLEGQCSGTAHHAPGPGASCSSHSGPGTQVEDLPQGGAGSLRSEVQAASESHASAHSTAVPDNPMTCLAFKDVESRGLAQSSVAGQTAGAPSTAGVSPTHSPDRGRLPSSCASGLSMLREAEALTAGEVSGSERAAQEQVLLKKALRAAAPSHLWLDMPDPTGGPACTWALADFIPGEAAVKPDCHGASLLAWCNDNSIVLSCRGEPTGYLTVTGDGSMVPGGYKKGVDVEAVHESLPTALNEMDTQDEKGLAAAQTPTTAPLHLLSKEGGAMAQSDGQPGRASHHNLLGSHLEIQNAEMCEGARKPDTALFTSGQTNMEGLLPEFASLPFLPVPPREGGTAVPGQVLPEVGTTPGYTESVLGGGSTEEAIAGLAVWESGVCQVILVLHQDGLLRAFPYPA